MKHVSKSTWERLKGESAADLHDELYHDVHAPGAASGPAPKQAPAVVHQPEDS